jgi:hypothetical protein
MNYDSSSKSLVVELGVRSSLHSHFLNLYVPVRVQADSNCLHNAISKGLIDDGQLSTILRFGCVGVLLQHMDYFTSQAVNQNKIFFSDDVHGEVIHGTLIDDGQLSTILRFGCVGVLLQHMDYFTSQAVNQNKIFFSDDVEGEVIHGTLIDVGFLLGTLSDMLFPRAEISIPAKLRNIPPNTLCYGDPSQILALYTNESNHQCLWTLSFGKVSERHF